MIHESMNLILNLLFVFAISVMYNCDYTCVKKLHVMCRFSILCIPLWGPSIVTTEKCCYCSCCPNILLCVAAMCNNVENARKKFFVIHSSHSKLHSQLNSHFTIIFNSIILFYSITLYTQFNYLIVIILKSNVLISIIIYSIHTDMFYLYSISFNNQFIYNNTFCNMTFNISFFYLINGF